MHTTCAVLRWCLQRHSLKLTSQRCLHSTSQTSLDLPSLCQDEDELGLPPCDSKCKPNMYDSRFWREFDAAGEADILDGAGPDKERTCQLLAHCEEAPFAIPYSTMC